MVYTSTMDGEMESSVQMAREAGKPAIQDAMVRGIPSDDLADVRRRACAEGVIPTEDGSKSDAIRWALKQWLSGLRNGTSKNGNGKASGPGG